MDRFYMVEMRPDVPALMRFLAGQGLMPKRNKLDLGYGIHAWITAAFGEIAPKPWRLLTKQRLPARILAYSQHSADELRQRLSEFADPSVYAVCPAQDKSISSRVMPQWQSGRQLMFEILCCPVGRKAASGIEKDLFLIRADSAAESNILRERVYCDWVQANLEREEAVTVDNIWLDGFQLVRQMRQGRRCNGHRQQGNLTRPQALVKGAITISDPEAFDELLRRGIGRHRSFGYGMILLRPPS